MKSLLKSNRRKCLLVLGMHRSGTSALCGILASLGAEPPRRLLQANGFNEKGFFEPDSIVRIHDELLSALGSSWCDPGPLPMGWNRHPFYRDVCARLTAEARFDFDGEGPFLLKDPRICRFVDLWVDVAERLDADVVPIHIFRNPYEVAASLSTRDGLDEATSMLLWLRHVLEAEYLTRPLPRVFVNYGELLRDRTNEMNAAFELLSMDLPPPSRYANDAADAFLDSELRHHVCRCGPLPPSTARWLKTVFAGLMRLRQAPGQPQVLQDFDRIRGQMNAATAEVEHALAPFRMAHLPMRESESRSP